MKTVLMVLGVILLAAVLFFLVGVLSPGQTNETVIKINSPLEYTWDLYHTDAVLKKWVPGLQEIQLQSGDNAEVGSTYLLTMKDQNGKVTTVNETITTFEKNDLYAMDYSDKMLDGHVDVHFEAQGDSTIIRSVNHYKGKTTFLKSMFHFFNGRIVSETEKQYDNFKLIVEESYMKHEEQHAKIIEPARTMPKDTLIEDELEN